MVSHQGGFNQGVRGGGSAPCFMTLLVLVSSGIELAISGALVALRTQKMFCRKIQHLRAQIKE
jgi:hypothetical protein